MKLSLACLWFAVAAILMHSCGASNKPAATPPPKETFNLPGTDWILADVAGIPALPGGKATLTFPDVGRVAGNASCNRFSGTMLVTGNAIKMGPLAMTRMACADNDINRQEDIYMKALGAAVRYSYENPDLLIYAEGYEKPLRFTRVPGDR